MVIVNRKRLMLMALSAVVVLFAGGVVGFRVAVGALRGKIVEVLGSKSEVRDIRLGWTSVNVEGLRIKGESGWPAADALRVERVAVVPSLRGLFSKQYRIRSITIAKPYFSVLRTEEGKLLALPGLLTGTVGTNRAQALSGLAVSSPNVAVGQAAKSTGGWLQRLFGGKKKP